MAKKERRERFQTVEGTVGGFISDGFSEIEEVGSELREAYDNAPENLQGSDVNVRRDEAASTCENISVVELESSILQELSCVTTTDLGKNKRSGASRSTRLSNAANKLRSAAEAIRAWLEENPLDDLDEEVDANDAIALKERAAKIEALQYDLEEFKSAHEEAESAADELETAAEEVEGVDCPGMFG